MRTICALIALTVALPLPEAYACSCAFPDTETVPADGATNVPIDTAPILFYAAGSNAGEPYLLDATGAEVEVEVEWSQPGGLAQYAVIRPAEPLEAGADYTFSDGDVQISFQTGSGESDLPGPADPSVLQSFASRSYEAECGVFVETSCDPLAAVQVDAGEIAGAAYYEARITLDGAVVAGTVLSPSSTFTFGDGGCLFNLSGMLEAEVVDIEVRGVSFAGEAGEWSEPISEVLPWPEDAACEDSSDPPGCAVGGGRSAGLWLAAAGLLLARFTRRNNPAHKPS